MSSSKPWGKITWYFIHTFCERINETFFTNNRETVLTIISNVCHMIPCPTCRTHAAQYLKKNPIMKMVKTKEELKIYFFRFHNQATLNGNPSARPADQSVIDMYKKANFKRIIDAFKHEYMKKTPTRLDYAHTLFAQSILRDTVSFVYRNIQWFVQQQTEIETETENITITINE